MGRARRPSASMIRQWVSGKFVTVVVWSTPLVNLLAWGAMRRADDWPLPTLMSYGPRWMWLALPVVLLPTVLVQASRALPLAVAAAIAAGPILQFQFSLRRAGEPASHALTITTMNAGMTLTTTALEMVVQRTSPQVIALQEWPDAGDTPPQVEGFNTVCEGNLCVLSRFPLRSAGALDRRLIGGEHIMAMRVHAATPAGDITVANVHLETVREGIEAVLGGRPDAVRELQENFAFRRRESRVVADWIAASRRPFLIAGDFNLPTDSAIYRGAWTRWANAFEVAGWGYGSTKFTSWWGLRIDHVLFDPSEFDVLTAGVADDVGSDHRPVVATFQRR